MDDVASGIVIREAAGSVSVGGELDALNVDDVEAVLRRHAAAIGREVRLDLEEVWFADVSSIARLVAICDGAAGDDVRVRIGPVSPAVLRVVSVLHRVESDLAH